LWLLLSTTTTGYNRNRWHSIGTFFCNCVEGDNGKLVNPTLLRIEEEQQQEQQQKHIIGQHASHQYKLYSNSLPSSTDNSNGIDLYEYKNGADEITKTVKRSNTNNNNSSRGTGGIQLRHK